MGLIGKAKDLFADPSKALSAAIYTEVSDCEDELNGLFTYDRRVRMHAHPLSQSRSACAALVQESVIYVLASSSQMYWHRQLCTRRTC